MDVCLRIVDLVVILSTPLRWSGWLAYRSMRASFARLSFVRSQML
jgi:hypothetical protein